MKIFIAAVMSVMLFACASSPTWEGMSEDDIAQWKANGFDARSAQVWHRGGFNAIQSKAWMEAKFDVDSAKDWSEEKFSAANWSQSGFELDDAVEERSKGLTPLKAK